jgi:hypothetical protein
MPIVVGEHADAVDFHVLGGLLPVLQRLGRLVGGVLGVKEREHQLLLVPAAVLSVLPRDHRVLSCDPVAFEIGKIFSAPSDFPSNSDLSQSRNAFSWS